MININNTIMIPEFIKHTDIAPKSFSVLSRKLCLSIFERTILNGNGVATDF